MYHIILNYLLTVKIQSPRVNLKLMIKSVFSKLFIFASPWTALYLIWHIVQVRYWIKKSFFFGIYLLLCKSWLSKIICAKRKHFFYIFPLMVIIKFLNGDVYVPRLLGVGNYHQQSSGGVVLTPRNLEGGGK